LLSIQARRFAFILSEKEVRRGTAASVDVRFASQGDRIDVVLIGQMRFARFVAFLQRLELVAVAAAPSEEEDFAPAKNIFSFDLKLYQTAIAYQEQIAIDSICELV
jgi:hypothetical protein